ncbi:MAG: sulfatase-like hydrolase/transferase [Armatimonadetes bacterium]|nr:sulfatase-like hydrolase/transferase [Armatimonadota bacterium]
MARTPNIVVTIADDQRFDTIGALGNGWIRTPYQDAMAEAGTALTCAHHNGSTHGAVCAPSRAMLFTGRRLAQVPERLREYWRDHGEDPALAEATPLLGELLRRGGYNCHAVGKWHNGHRAFQRCFDSGEALFFGGMSDHDKVPIDPFDPDGIYPPERRTVGAKFSTELFTDAAVDFVRGYDEDRPFFLFVAYTAPHDPRTPPADVRYAADQVPLPANYLPMHPFNNGELTIRDERLAGYPRTPREVRQHLADYAGMITDLDRGLGRLHAALAESGHADDTVVIHTADHGLAVGQHGLMGKQNLYEHSIRVPLLVRGPGIPVGHRVDELCYQHDLYPTLLELAGIEPPEPPGFRSLLPLLAGAPGYDTVTCSYAQCQQMAKDRRHKLIRYRPVHGRGSDYRQVFDLAADPLEQTNLAGSPELAEVEARLESHLVWEPAEP